MAEVGTIYATLAVSAKGISQQISREMGDAGSAGGASASKGFLSSATGLVGKTVGIAAGAVAAVGGLIGGLAIKGGISKALQIEDARGKLAGLKHDTKSIDMIMANALGSVKGTAFGLGEAATVAASTVAAGIKPGKDLQRVLSLTADAATIAGTDIGSMGAIFNKIAASGKVSGLEMLQLSKAGIPVLQWIAKEYGVTAGEATKMVSAGKVDFETFSKLIQENIGGAALASGGTTRGAFANMKASFSNFGMVLTGWFMPLMKDVFGSVNKIMDSFTKKLTPIANKFADVFQKKAGPIIKGFADTVTKQVDRVGIAGSMLWKGFSGNLPPSVLDNLPILFRIGDGVRRAADEVKGGIKAFGAAFKEGGTDITSGGFAGALETLGLVFGNLWDAIGPTVENLGPKLLAFATAFSPLLVILNALLPVLPGLSIALGALASALGTGLGVALEALAPVLESVLTSIAGVLTWITDSPAGVEGLTAVILLSAGAWATYSAATSIAAAKTAFMAASWAFITGAGILSTLAQMGLYFIGLARTQGIATAAQWAFNVAANANPIGLIIGIIVLVIAAIVGLIIGFKMAYEKIGWFKDAVDAVFNFIKSAAGAVSDWFTGTFVPALTGIWPAIVDIWNNSIGMFADFFSNTLGMFSDFGSNTIGMFSGFFTNTGGMFVDFFTNTVGMASDFVGKLAAPFSMAMAVVGVVFKQGWEILQTYVATVLSVIIALVTGKWDRIPGYFVSMFQKIGGFFTDGLAQIDGILGGALTRMVDGAVSIWTGFVDWVKGIPDMIMLGLIKLAQLGITFGLWIGSVKDAAVAKFLEIVDWVKGVPGLVMAGLIQMALLGLTVGTWIAAVKDAAIGKFLELVVWVAGIPGMVMNGLIGIAGLALTMGVWVGGVKDAAVAKFFELIDWVGGLPGRIVGALGNVGSLLVDAGKNILQGFLDGLTAGFESVQNFVGGIGTWIADHKGPKAYDLALLVPAGGHIMTGLDRGLQAGIPTIKSTLGDVSSTIRSGVKVPSAPAYAGDIGGSASSGRGSSGPLVEQHIHPAPGMSAETVGQISANSLDYQLRMANA